MSEVGIKISGVCIRLGGERHTGWLPPGAATPRATPTRQAKVDLIIELNGAGPDCILVCEAQDRSFCWETWHESIEEAKRAAHEAYGVEPSQWAGENSN